MRKLISLLLVITTAICLILPVSARDVSYDFRQSTPQLEELIEAVSLGFGDSVDGDSDMTYAGYYAMLEKLVAAVKMRDNVDFADKLAAWKTKYPDACDSTETLTRINAMYMIYTLAYDVLGGDYALPISYMPSGQTWGTLHKKMGNNVWDEIWHDGICELNTSLFWDCYGGDDHPEYKVTFDNISFDRQSAAYYYSFGKTSVSGWPLFEYDSASNSMRVTDTLTMGEAMLSCLRLYESVDPFAMEVGLAENKTNISDTDTLSYRTDIITPALLARADYMETPTVDDLPYYTGVHHSWIGTDAEPMESAFRNYAELGFNYVRLDLTCINFFGIGADVDQVSDVPNGVLSEDETAVTQVDMACLTKLDEMISWGLKYGLHIALQFSDHPGHIQFLLNNGSTADTDFYWNNEKQEQTALMWKTIAERYKDIPSSALSFIINHEPFNIKRSTAVDVTRLPTETEIVTAVSAVAKAVREADEDRFMYYHSSQGMHVDSFMTDGELETNLGLAQMFNSDKREFSIWNLITDVDFSAGYYPDWPCYVIPSRLTYYSDNKDPQHRPSLTINGFLPEGTAFNIYMKSDGPLTVTAKDASGKSVSLKTAMLDSTGGSSAERSFTLPDNVSSVTLELTSNSYVDFQSFRITLPSQYSKKHYYTDGNTVSQPNDSILDVKLSSNSDNVYNHLETVTALNSGFEHCWILDEGASADLTITHDETTNACSYTSNYGFTTETLNKAAELYAAEQELYDTAGMNVEFFCSPYNTQSEVVEFYDALLSSYEDNGIGWALYFSHTLYTAFYAGATQTYADGSGLLMNNGIPESLQAHLGKRPEIIVKVPSASGNTASLYLENTEETNADFHVIAAVYDQNGKLLAVSKATENIPANTTGLVSVSLPTAGTKVKLFRLDPGYKPIGPAVVITPA